jgi:hypothetical protein
MPLLLSLLLVLAIPAVAETPRAWGEHPQWLALLHYEHPGSGSYVRDPDFFLHENGDRDPVAELEASRQRLSRDAELRCRFVARYQWLRDRGLIEEQYDPRRECEEYRQWRDELNTGRAVLVFAASYLNSPSSMFGHTFLRFDPADSRMEATLMSFALNFGAVVPPGDNSLLFAWRGIGGGYPGYFTLQPYYEKVQEYSRLENRDLWEYPLDLDAEELDRLLAHVWELRETEFGYYFFKQNCSFRLLELLEVARPGIDLTGQFRSHAIPADTVQVVDRAGMVADAHYRPSRQVELQHLLDQLDREGRRLAHRLARDPAVAESEDFLRRGEREQHLIVLAAYRYLRYRQNREVRDQAVAGNSLALLRLLHQRPSAGSSEPDAPRRPDRGHDTTLVSAAAGHEEGQDYVEVGLRLAYHDLLDPVAGYPEGASLNMGQLRLRAGRDLAPRLQQLDIVEITSVAPRDRFFRPLSWRVNTGLERQFVGQRDALATQVNGGVGGTWRLGPVTPYTLATARLEYNRGFDNNLQAAPGAAVGLLWQGQRAALLASADWYRFIDEGESRLQLGVAAQWHLGRNRGLRLDYSHRRHGDARRDAVQLELRQYF